MTDSSYYAPSNYTISNSELNNTTYVASAHGSGWYSSKGYKNNTFNFWATDLCQGTEITFDTGMWVTKFAVLTNNHPGSGFEDGGGVRAWIFASDTDGLPGAFVRDLGIAEVPTAETGEFPWQQTVTEKVLDTGLYLPPNEKFWIVSAAGLNDGEGGWTTGPGPDIAITTDAGLGSGNNTPLNDGNIINGAGIGGYNFGTVAALGGINASTDPTDAGTLYTDLNASSGGFTILLYAVID